MQHTQRSVWGIFLFLVICLLGWTVYTGFSTPLQTNKPGFSTPLQTNKPGFSTPLQTNKPGFSTPLQTNKPGFSTPLQTNKPDFSTPLQTNKPGFSTPLQTNKPSTMRILRVYPPNNGRLGNKLHSLACIYGLARTNRRRLVITPALIEGIAPFINVTKLRTAFEISTPPGDVLRKWARYAFYQPKMEQFKEDQDILFAGYIQVSQYFQPYEQEVRKLFVINTNLVSEAQGFLHAINQNVSNESTFVGIHVRRTDMVNKKLGYLGPSPEYLRGAMTYYLRKYRNVHFIICTDDRKHCETNETYLQPGKLRHIADYGIHYSTLTSPSEDLALLAQCNHSIMTVGTFGWWGGWLAGGEVIYFNESIGKGSYFDKNFRNQYFFWPTWIGMGDHV